MRLLGLAAPASSPRPGCGAGVASGGERANDGGTHEHTNGRGSNDGLRPDVSRLSAEQRAALADAWKRDGLGEHASVAAFGRFALELLAVGAPASFVADAHRAALDEVRHAKLCLELASAYAGNAIAPGPFDFGRGVGVGASLPVMAARTFLRVCAGETLEAVRAAEQLALATDPAARAALATIVEDGARHAELGWRTVAWALDAGGEPVREALREAIGEITLAAPPSPVDPLLCAHGQLDGAAARLAMGRALRDVVLPCARCLVDGIAPEAEDAAPEAPEADGAVAA